MLLFKQRSLKQDRGDKKIVMKITGKLVDILVMLVPEIYGKFVVFENGKKVLYVEVFHALYGMCYCGTRNFEAILKKLDLISTCTILASQIVS